MILPGRALRCAAVTASGEIRMGVRLKDQILDNHRDCITSA